MDDEHVFAFVEAVHRTHFHAVHVFTFDAIIDDDVSHSALVLKRLSFGPFAYSKGDGDAS
jgi:hypothetical protein